ncbi:MAG: UbiA family prenyltransferase [Crocinitomicaceae bacterium]
MINKLRNFLILIRWFHELLALFPFITLFLIINYELSLIPGHFEISTSHFMLVCLGVQALMIPNFILNDIVDAPIDKINKPTTHIVGRVISLKRAKALFWIFSGIAFLLSVYISMYIFIEWSVISFCVFSLSIAYNLVLKRSPLFGNITIALLAAFVPLVLMFFLKESLALINNERLYVLIYIYSLLLLLITIPRELSLDISDIEGDKANGCKTLPILIGEKKSKIVVTLFMFFVLILSILTMIFYPYLASTFIIMDLFYIYFMIKLWKNKQRKEYIINGRIIWGAMIFGLVGSTIATMLL